MEFLWNIFLALDKSNQMMETPSQTCEIYTDFQFLLNALIYFK